MHMQIQTQTTLKYTDTRRYTYTDTSKRAHVTSKRNATTQDATSVLLKSRQQLCRHIRMVAR